MTVELRNSTNDIVTAQHTDLDLAVSELDHPVWNSSQPIQIARKWSGEDAPVSRHAEARIIWSEESLAVRFVCRQAEPLLVNPNPQLDQKTIGLWHRDVCEIFIAPEAKAPGRYFEFEAAPTAEWVDLAIELAPTGRQTDFDFHSGMTAAAIVAEGRTMVAMRIPWSASIPKPQRADTWKVNLFRCVGTGDDRYLAWQPTYTAEPNFHVPDVFGSLLFA